MPKERGFLKTKSESSPLKFICNEKIYLFDQAVDGWSSSENTVKSKQGNCMS